MYPTVSSLKHYIKPGDINIDNWVFRLHRQATFVLLLAFEALGFLMQVILDPIDCFTTVKDDPPSNVLDNYCWVQTTFSLPGAFHKRVGVDVIYPGIDTHTDPEAPITYHSYYQWVCFFLLLQAIMFYVPYFAWQVFDSGKIKRLVEVTKLSDPVADCTDSVKEANNNKMASYFVITMGHNKFYAIEFLLCECCNFANVVGQIYFANAFLGGEFADLGMDVIRYSRMDQANRTDPLIQLFPRITKCALHKVGVGGNIQMHDALCVLPVNMINEKIFIILWFWFVLLAVITGTFLIYRFSLIVPMVRNADMCFEFSNKKLPDVLNECSYADWFVLDLLRKNVNSINFGSLVEEIARQLDKGNNPEQDPLMTGVYTDDLRQRSTPGKEVSLKRP